MTKLSVHHAHFVQTIIVQLYILTGLYDAYSAVHPMRYLASDIITYYSSWKATTNPHSPYLSLAAKCLVVQTSMHVTCYVVTFGSCV